MLAVPASSSAAWGIGTNDVLSNTSENSAATGYGPGWVALTFKENFPIVGYLFGTGTLARTKADQMDIRGTSGGNFGHATITQWPWGYAAGSFGGCAYAYGTLKFVRTSTSFMSASCATQPIRPTTVFCTDTAADPLCSARGVWGDAEGTPDGRSAWSKGCPAFANIGANGVFSTGAATPADYLGSVPVGQHLDLRYVTKSKEWVMAKWTGHPFVPEHATNIVWAFLPRNCVSVTQTSTTNRRAPGDFDGSGTTDLTVFRPADGTWYVRNQAAVQWGQSGDVPVPADYSGDGFPDLAVWRPTGSQGDGYWYMGFPPNNNYQWGAQGDVPVPADYNADGHADLAVWRPGDGTWYVNGVGNTPWGVSGDYPVPGDYNGDGRADIAIWRPTDGALEGYWYVKDDPQYGRAQWGAAGDVPVPGDYNGDGKTDLAVWRPSNGTWYVNGMAPVQWGQSGDVPVPGDYSGDGVTDPAFWRPSDKYSWYVRTPFVAFKVQWGQGGDIPATGTLARH
jgi:hypothetical protein